MVDMEKQEEAGGTQVIGWNLAALSQEDKEQVEQLWRERARGRVYMGAESTGNNVKSEAEWCQEALSKVLDATAKKIMIYAWPKRRWNGEIKERRSQLGREIRRRRKLAATAQAKPELHKSIRRAKDRMWNDYLKNLRGAEVRRAATFANPWAGAIVEALTDRDGKQANTITEKEDMLRRESIPPNEQEQHFELPPAGQAHQSVTEQAVERALLAQAAGKAPGLDTLCFGAVRLL